MARTSSKAQHDEIANARRAQILTAAIHVFADKGFTRATIKDVAREAGIADGTVYIYFKSKTDLLLGIMNLLNESDEREAQFAQALEGDVREFFRAYIRRRLDMLLPQGHEMMQVILSEVLVNAELRDLYYQQIVAPSFDAAHPIFDALIARGDLRPFDSDLTIRTIAAATLGLLVLRVMGDGVLKDSWESVPDLLTDLLFQGLAPVKG